MSGWDPVPRSWMRRPGGGLPAGMLLARIAAGGLAACALVAVAAYALPLDRGEPVLSDGETGAAADRSLREVERLLGDRRADPARIATLGESYLFRIGRRPAESPRVAQTDEPETPEPAPEPSEPEQRGSDPSERADAVRVVRVESAEDVGGEIRDSFRELVLRAIHTDRSGRLVALIDFASSGVADAAVRAREGDDFVEPKHKDSAWRVVVIDPERNRVVIERQDRRLALALFGTGAADLSPVVIRPEAEPGEEPERVRVAPDGTVIVQKRPEEAVAELRGEVGGTDPEQKPITLDDLGELLDAVRELERYAERERIERERRSGPD